MFIGYYVVYDDSLTEASLNEHSRFCFDNKHVIKWNLACRCCTSTKILNLHTLYVICDSFFQLKVQHDIICYSWSVVLFLVIFSDSRDVITIIMSIVICCSQREFLKKWVRADNVAISQNLCLFLIKFDNIIWKSTVKQIETKK